MAYARGRVLVLIAYKPHASHERANRNIGIISKTRADRKLEKQASTNIGLEKKLAIAFSRLLLTFSM